MWTESMNTVCQSAAYQLHHAALYPQSDSQADPVVERLDPRRFFRHRLYRDATTYTGGKHIKDLTALNRNLEKVCCDAPLRLDCQAVWDQ